jgi:ABC-2 type transport system ATP-binding protein
VEVAIKVEGLQKVYISHKKEPNFWGSLKGLVRRKYLYTEAVKGISFSIRAGEFVGYIGPNGAGKTTTLKLLSGLLYPTDGEASVLGFIPWERKDDFRRRIAFVMGQKTQLWWDLPAIESFSLNKEIYEIPKKVFDGRVDYLTSLLSVRELLNIPVRNLSLGERMKFELIGSLLHHPDVLFLDEPTIGLDVISQKKIRDFLKEYNRTQKTTIILTSHYMRDVEELCKRVILINEGNIVFDGALTALTQTYTQNKLLKITFFERIPEGIEQFGNVISRDELKVILQVDRKRIAQVSREVLRGSKVEDITIEERPIEDVIREIFSSKQNVS